MFNFRNAIDIKIRMKTKAGLISILLTLSLHSLAQIRAVTENGKDVILSTDGTWQFVDSTINSEEPLNLDCKNLISTDTDKVTGKSTTGAKEALLVTEDGGKTGFGIYLFKGSNSLICSITAVGAGSCIDDDDKANILFRDRSRIELINDSKFNCDANFTLYFGGIFGKKRELESLKTKEIETLRIWTSDGYVEKDFTSDQSKTLIALLTCLSD